MKLNEIPHEWRDSHRQAKEAVYVDDVDEISEEDFTNYVRSVLLPAPSKGLCEAIGIVEKRVLLKRGIFAKTLFDTQI